MSSCCLEAQLVHVVRRAEQAALLGAPEGQPHLVPHPLVGQLEPDLAAARREPVPLSLMPGPAEHRVQVRAGHHHVVRAAARASRRSRCGWCGSPTRSSVATRAVTGPACDRARRTARPRRSRCRPPGSATGLPRVTGDRVGPARLALVEDDHGGGAGGRGVGHLDLEGAGAALDQRDVAGGEAGEVGGLAAGGRRRSAAVARDVEVDRLHVGGDLTGAGELEGEDLRARRTKTFGSGETRSSSGGACSWKKLNGNSWYSTSQPAAGQLVVHVRRPRRRSPACRTARVPPFWSAIRWKAMRWRLTPLMVTSRASLRPSRVLSPGAAWAGSAPAAAVAATTTPTSAERLKTRRNDSGDMRLPLGLAAPR